MSDIRPILKLANVSFSRRGCQILDDISFVVHDDDYIGIIGPNGGGKTTLLRIILGLEQPDQGTVEVFDKKPASARGLVGYVPQFSKFDRDFPSSVIDVVLMGRQAKRKLFQKYTVADYDVARQCLESVGLSDFAERQIGNLSGGELQRVLIARALALEPKLLLLDEPTASVDTPFGEVLYQFLGEISKKMAVVLVSHDIGALAKQVKTIGCLNRKLFYHHDKEISDQTIENVYGCAIDLIAHGHAHRVLSDHHGEK